MDELIAAMSIAELEKFKVDYKENDSVVKIIDGYIEVKARQEIQAIAKAAFGKAIEKLASKLPHPEDVHNVYLQWREVDEPIADSEPEVISEDVCKANGLEVGTIRQPTHKVWQWAVELNKGFTTGKTATTTTTSKRAITVKRIHDDKAPEFVGRFASASKACEHLELVVGQDSAMRVLTVRNPYIAQPYDGTDFLA